MTRKPVRDKNMYGFMRLYYHLDKTISNWYNSAMELKCPVCEYPIELPATARAGKRVTCPDCFAQMALFKHKGKALLGCALCKEPVFDPKNCEECERRRDKKKILEEGAL